MAYGHSRILISCQQTAFFPLTSGKRREYTFSI